MKTNQTEIKVTRQPMEDGDEGPNRDQILGSDVLKFVMEHGDAYPLPDELCHFNPIFNDLPNTVVYDSAYFVSVTKSFFARSMCTSQSQVSRWIKAGLPVRPDRRIQWRLGMNWVEKYQAKNEERRMMGWVY